MKCADCKYFDRRMLDSRHDGYCMLELPPFLTDYIVSRGVSETNGCDLGELNPPDMVTTETRTIKPWSPGQKRKGITGA